MNKKTLFILVSAFSWFAAAELAKAGSASDSLQVSATVSKNCTVSTNMALVTYDPFSAGPNDTTGSVEITCTSGATVIIELNLGLNALSSQRRMTDTGTNYINYGIYQDAARTVEWGTGADAMSNTGTGALQSIPAYGRIPGLQSVPAGTYTDTVQATVIF